MGAIGSRRWVKDREDRYLDSVMLLPRTARGGACRTRILRGQSGAKIPIQLFVPCPDTPSIKYHGALEATYHIQPDPSSRPQVAAAPNLVSRGSESAEKDGPGARMQETARVNGE